VRAPPCSKAGRLAIRHYLGMPDRRDRAWHGSGPRISSKTDDSVMAHLGRAPRLPDRSGWRSAR